MSGTIDELQRLGLISKICSELDNHLGYSDKTLAEFIIHIAEKTNFLLKDFQKQLNENGAEFPSNYSENLLRIINAVKRGKQSEAKNETVMSKSFPSLSRPNEQPINIDNQEDFKQPNSYNDDLEVDKEKDYKKDRPMSRSRSRSNTRRERGRSRSRDRKSPSENKRNDRRDNSRERRHRSSDRGRRRSRSRSRSQDRSAKSKEPEIFGIYDGKVANITDFGCFVELIGYPKKEGLVHISQMGQGAGRDPRQIVKRGQRVKVKVTSIVGAKMALSMKEVDQSTGKDLVPARSKEMLDRANKESKGTNSVYSESSFANPSAPANSRLAQEDNFSSMNAKRRLSSQEMWETQQLINSGILKVSDYPTFDAESGRGVLQDVEVEENVDIELNEDEPVFLKGQTKMSREFSPVKIVKSLDGSLQRAALHQSQLAKERKELKQAQVNNLIDAIPKDLSKPWEDPMPEDGERHFAQELRSINIGGSFEMPEWKQKTQGKSLSYGQISNKSIRDQRESLPIFRLRSQLCSAIAQNQVLIVIGETGSGKTTQMTQYMAEMGYCEYGMIGCTQPRRVAALSVAKRVAEEYGCTLGQEVGYTIRFEDCTSSATKIKYMTDGMLMREYLADNNLSRYVAVMLDEAHERTIHTDVLFGLLKKLLQKRSDFKLIVTSATLDAEKFSRYFFNCPIFTIPGRTFPVEILYCNEPEPDYLEAALITVMQIHLSEPAGDVLVFLTGQEEIDTCAEILYNRMKALGELAPELIILPVYGALPSEMQSRIFEPAPPGSRKCVIATNM